MEKHFKNTGEPTHFIEAYRTLSSSLIFYTDLLQIDVLKKTLKKTIALSNLETIAVFKIYPKLC